MTKGETGRFRCNRVYSRLPCVLVKRAGLLVAVLAGLFVGAPSASAAAPFAPCGDNTNGLQCGTLSVPIDYANPSGGQLGLYVEVLPAVGTPRGVMFILAGGPGQASAETFNLGLKAAYWRSFFPGYTLVAYDDRGTGDSGLLDCPLLQTAVSADQQQAQAAACATIIGPQRDFYRTAQQEEDLDAVRQ